MATALHVAAPPAIAGRARPIILTAALVTAASTLVAFAVPRPATAPQPLQPGSPPAAGAVATTHPGPPSSIDVLVQLRQSRGR